MRIVTFSLISFFLLFCSACSITQSNEINTTWDSPESTLATYFDAYNKKRHVVVASCFYPPAHDFYIPNKKFTIDDYQIKKKMIFNKKEAMRINEHQLEIKIKEKDVQLDVLETLEGQTQMTSYFFREFGHEWKIITHYSWDQP